MQQLIYYIQKYRFFLFFLLLELIALNLILNNRSFHKSKFVNSANSITGGFYNKVSIIKAYFNLKEENIKLAKENLILKNKNEKILQILDSIHVGKIIDSSLIKQRYSYTSGNIEKNQYSSNYNFLTINLGKKDSIFSEMAVINSKGILGITEIISTNYSRVQSILNKNSKINAKLKNSNHFGSLEWNGLDYNIVQLLDIPRQAIIEKGDTIITGGRSSIFPEGLLIGKVVNIEQQSSIKRVVNIQLFNDMSNVKNIYVIKDFDKEEIRELDNSNDE
ncbi:MAG: Cell shape-determining protein MreC [Flavobacterium sp. SCGC AAA160-P02]|nr:MAG: Cell shape-determining protein MreC [Flavobacterium sp. SCGC AAA160-P02]